MKVLDDALFLVAMASVALLLVGLIRPQAVRCPNRFRALLVYGGLTAGAMSAGVAITNTSGPPIYLFLYMLAYCAFPIAFLGLFLGLIRPGLADCRDRRTVATRYATALILSFVCALAFASRMW